MEKSMTPPPQSPLVAFDRLVEALQEVVAIADRKTDEFDKAHAAILEAPALRAALEEMEARLAALTAEPSEVVVGKVAAAIADARVKRVNPGVNIECLMTDNSKGDYDKAKAAIAAYRRAMGGEK